MIKSLMLEPGSPFPDLVLHSLDNQAEESLHGLKKKKHSLLLLIQGQDARVLALLQEFEKRRELFNWYEAPLIAVFASSQDVPQPWPLSAAKAWALAPGSVLAPGLAWGCGYLISRHKTLFSVYPDLAAIDLDQVERDLMVWEARHC